MAQTIDYICPRCSLYLAKGQFNNLPVAVCRKCMGFLVGGRNLTKLIEQMADELTAEISADARIQDIPDKGGAALCPVCRKAMENFGYMGSNLIKIDRCFSCNMVWLDALELGAMGLMYAKTEKRRAKRVEMTNQRAKDYTKMLNAQALAHIAYNRFYRRWHHVVDMII